ncbi:hypothetical protein LCGC14_2808510, partial [marine sediment metagenome]
GKAAWGLKADTGKSVYDELDLTRIVKAAPASREMPLVTLTGRKIPPAMREFVLAMLEKGHPVMMAYKYWSGPKLVPVSASGTWGGSMIRLDVRRDRLMPVFGRYRGAALRTAWATKPYSELNLHFRWDTASVVDRADRAEISVWRRQLPRGEAAVTDITLRRAQRFKAKPGQTFRWTLGKKSGAVTADGDGLVTIRGVALSETPTKLVVSRK